MAGPGYIDLIIGAQYGSEGKGKLCSLLAPDYTDLVRSGGPNAGHWVRDRDYSYCFHHLPSGSIANPTANLYLAAGATFWPAGLHKEIADLGNLTGNRFRLTVDRNAMAITGFDRESERNLVSTIGSTGQGVGAAQIRRLERSVDSSDLVPTPGLKYGRVNVLLHAALKDHGAKVMLEGTQGSGLSLYHGYYPWVTSRDTNASGLLAEIGLPAHWVRDTWLVVRPYPIRTGGNSGPLMEISWADLENRLGYTPGSIAAAERTSTTNRQRRVGEFDWEQFEQACIANAPTHLFLSFGDYLSPDARYVTEWSKFPPEVSRFIDMLENMAGVPVAGVSTGPSNVHVAWSPAFEYRRYRR